MFFTSTKDTWKGMPFLPFVIVLPLLERDTWNCCDRPGESKADRQKVESWEGAKNLGPSGRA